jgi:hypothetical protein
MTNAAREAISDMRAANIDIICICDWLLPGFAPMQQTER